METLNLFFVSIVYFVYICGALKDQKQYQLILNKSREMFMKHGIKALTMDEIAKGLGMSKKTIYQFVDNKSELVRLTLKDYLDEERSLIDGILKKSSNSIEEMVQMIEYFLQAVSEFNTSALDDMQKYYPETWDLYNDYRFNYMLTCIKDNLQNGVNQGYYRKDLQTEVIAKIYILGVETLFNQYLFPPKQYAFLDIYRKYLDYHLRGIVSPKGLKYLEEHNLFKD